MLKKLFANKKWSILIMIVTFVFVGILMTVFISKNPKDKGKSDISIETEQNKYSETSEEDDGDGLEAQDTLDESVYTIDGSGDWAGGSDENTKKEQEESDDKNDVADEELDKDILVDDKVWGPIN